MILPSGLDPFVVLSYFHCFASLLQTFIAAVYVGCSNSIFTSYSRLKIEISLQLQRFLLSRAIMSHSPEICTLGGNMLSNMIKGMMLLALVGTTAVADSSA